MLPSCRNLFSRGAFVSLAAALLLAGCGGDGGGDSPPPANTTFPPSASLAGICTLPGEMAFLRSYMDEVYLWYNEIPAVDPANFNSIPAYMNALLVRTPDAAGLPKDQFSAIETTQEADARQASAFVSQRIERALKDDPVALRCSQPPQGSVPLFQVVTSPAGRKAGYVLFNDHQQGAQDALIAAFQNLKASGVQDLVLDMRCNTGGFLYVAQTAASMVTGPEKEGMVFEHVRFNDKREAETRAGIFRFSTTVQSSRLADTYRPGYPLPQLSLPRVYVLSSSLTCSASESIVNGLRGVDVEVVLVGGKTCGKPYGFQRKDNCGYAIYPIEFQGFNAKNFGDYTTGFAPTCTVADDPDIARGTPEEPLLKTALSHADTGSCPPGTAPTGLQPLDLRSATRSGSRSPIGERLVLHPKHK
jgi:hypothetical protein